MSKFWQYLWFFGLYILTIYFSKVKLFLLFFQLKFEVLGRHVQFSLTVWKDVLVFKMHFSLRLWDPQDDFVLCRYILWQRKFSFVKLSSFHIQTNLLTVLTNENNSAVQTKGCNKLEKIFFGKKHLVNAIKTALSCKCQFPSLAGRGPSYLEPLSNWEPD